MPQARPKLSMMLGVLVVVLVALTSIFMVGVHDANAASAQPTNCTECDFPCNMITGAHTAPVQANGTLGGWHTNCRDDQGACPHPTCAKGAQADRIDGILSDLRTLDVHDAAQLSAFLQEHRDGVTLNVTREALQVAGCEPGRLAAHIPLEPIVVASLVSLRTDLAAR